MTIKVGDVNGPWEQRISGEFSDFGNVFTYGAVTLRKDMSVIGTHDHLLKMTNNYTDTTRRSAIIPRYASSQQTAAYGSHIWASAETSLFTDDELMPYFDSTMGVTAGQRFGMMPNYEGSNQVMVRINSDGTIEKVMNFTTTHHFSSVAMFHVFKESTNFLYVVVISGYGAYNNTVSEANHLNCKQIFKVDKTTFVNTALLPSSTGQIGSYSSVAGRHLKIMGEIDNRLVIAFTPAGGAQGYPSHYFWNFFLLDLEAGSINWSGNITTFQAMEGMGHSTYIGAIPSSLVDDPASVTHKVAYTMDSDGEITRIRIPKAATLYTQLETNITTGYTSIGMKSVNSSGYSSYGNHSQTTGWAFTDNGNTYVGFLYHNKNAWVDTYGYSSGNVYGVSVANATLAVYRVDPTDSTILTEVQNTAPYSNDAVVTEATDQLHMIVPSTDKKLFIAASTQRCYEYIWQTGIEQYQINGPIVPQGFQYIGKVGLDYSNRIWIEGEGAANRNKFEVYNFAANEVIDVQWVNDISTLEFTGSPAVLTETVNLNTYDVNGTRVVKNVNIEIVGATFPDDTTVKQFTTSATVNTTFDVKIAQPGNINIIPSLV